MSNMDKYLDREPTMELIRQARADGEGPLFAFKDYCEAKNIERTEVVMIIFWQCVSDVREETE